MKTLAIILVLGFASRPSNAFWPDVVERCIVENGFTKSEDNIGLVDAIGDPEDVDILKNVGKEKLAAAVACMFSKGYTKTNLHDMLKFLTNIDDKVTEDQRLQMIDTLTTCNTQAKGNDAELLNCVKAFVPPFDYLVATLHELGERPLNPCYGKCGLKIPDLYALELYEKRIDKLLNRMSGDSLYCVTACKSEQEDDNPKQFIYKIFTKGIEAMPEEKRNEMKGTMEKCYTEGGYKNVEMGALEKTISEGTKLREAYQLLKCIKLYETPFIDLFKH